MVNNRNIIQISQYTRSLVFFSFFFGWTFLLLFVYLPTLLLPRKTALIFYKFWAASVLFGCKYIAGIDVKVEGIENLKKQPVILASQHQSTWETMFLVLILKDPTYILKKELLFIPLFGLYLWKAKVIAIYRKKGKKSLETIIEQAKDCFDNGRSIIIFPEGTRLPPGQKKPFKYGVAGLYEFCQKNYPDVPVVPVALNSGCFWPRRQMLLTSGVVTVKILPPMADNIPTDRFLSDLQDKIWLSSDELFIKS